MKIESEVKLSAAEESQLAGILKIKPEQLNSAFGPFAVAAVEEYIRMFLGQKVFTRGSDMREYRLSLLIPTAFNNTIPDEQMICALFQCTLLQSRALLRAVMSKYQYELSDAIKTLLKVTVQNVRLVDGDYLVTVKNANIVTELNMVLASIDSAQDEVLRLTGKLATYELKPAAYKALCKQFQVKPIDNQQ